MENIMNKNNELKKRMVCCRKCNSSFILNSKNSEMVDTDIDLQRTQYEEFYEVSCPSCEHEFDVNIIYSLDIKEIECWG